MSNFLKTTALTSSLVIASLTSAFSQNKSDIKLSKDLTADSTYQTNISQNDTGDITITQSRYNSPNSSVSLNLMAKDLNKNGTIEADEVSSFAYTELKNSKWTLTTGSLKDGKEIDTLTIGPNAYSSENIGSINNVLPNFQKRRSILGNN